MSDRTPRRWWRHLPPATRAMLAWIVLLAVALACFARGAYLGVGVAALVACLLSPSEPPP